MASASTLQLSLPVAVTDRASNVDLGHSPHAMGATWWTGANSGGVDRLNTPTQSAAGHSTTVRRLAARAAAYWAVVQPSIRAATSSWPFARAVSAGR